jgi:APA family basic amino acid/polyamine antiporter
VAVAALLLVTGMHAFDLSLGRRFQVASTLLKLVVIAVFCAVGLAHGVVPGSLPLAPTDATCAT